MSVSTRPSPFVIAVDGPSAAGKGTLARRVAAHFNLAYLDTGLLYRAVAARLLRAGIDRPDEAAAIAAARAVSAGDLDLPELREEAVSQMASKVAAISGVRAALLDLQRTFAAAPPAGPSGPVAGAVLDGRDIGTVVWPQAQVKLFIHADLEQRARRRHKELIERGGESIYARVLQDMRERDARDSGRSVAPLTPAPDALVIDTSALDADAAFAIAVAHIGSRCQDSAEP
ncbi:(d)CMP kinase [Rhodospirillaceae bacterium SYSU D60014]|uniref:(d)CMP kinase n=1 Tax=Virgifigura deserti TaxID=2268457 RepID=UPI000E66D6C7